LSEENRVHRTIIKRSQLTAEDAVVTPAIPVGTTKSGPTPKRAVIVAHEGRPIAIEVTCSCGEVTVVEIDIESAEKQA